MPAASPLHSLRHNFKIKDWVARFVCDYKVEKPKDWPANSIEVHLENLMRQIEIFKKEPSYENKEVLISLVSHYDLNQVSICGLVRTTVYEVACINALYYEAVVCQCYALKTFLYDLIGEKTRLQKMISWFPDTNCDSNIKEFRGLQPTLKLYHNTYKAFNAMKERKFVEELIGTIECSLEVVEKEYSEDERKSKIDFITRNYITLINDISYFQCLKRNKIWAFERDELVNIFKLVAKLVKLNDENPLIRPLKGVLMTCISNYILKSRNNYNEDYICKYISENVAQQSIENNQIWMAEISKLNDEREQKVVPDLFKEIGWQKYTWANNINFDATRKYYVSSFCKSINDEKMLKDYGGCIYGYKDDRIAELIAPITYCRTDNGLGVPKFSQVVAFDVIYDKKEVKSEINFLCEIIDCFDMQENEKRKFLEDIMQYWILSVKDEEWEHERERRYVIFMYDNYEYKDAEESTDNFLKVKTTLFLTPDFILGNNPVSSYISNFLDNKRMALYQNEYLFCKNCLNIDFDVIKEHNDIKECPICGSSNIKFVNKEY